MPYPTETGRHSIVSVSIYAFQHQSVIHTFRCARARQADSRGRHSMELMPSPYTKDYALLKDIKRKKR